jgi:Ca-activated chloride channel homolog
MNAMLARPTSLNHPASQPSPSVSLETGGNPMRSFRRAARVMLLSSIAVIVALVATDTSTAQPQKPAEKDGKKTEQKTEQKSEQKELLTVQPAAAPTPPDKTQQPSTKILLPQGEVDEKNPVITNTDLITFNVTVTDIYGRFVSGLSKNAFNIFDDKSQQDITFFSDEDAPVSVGVLFDVSGSMSGEKVRRARDALAHFIQTSHDRDEYFLIGFNSRAQLLMDRTRDGNAVLDKLTFVQTKNNTALYDACYLGVERVQRGTHPKRALLLISDGQDNNSRYTFNELRRVLKESDVVLYAIGILGGSDVGSALGMEGQGILDELAGVSGGKAFYPRSGAEMDDIFEQIALELRHQYSIGYKPANFNSDGKWHKIKVTVHPPRGLPRLFVRSKEGYFAIANPK